MSLTEQDEVESYFGRKDLAKIRKAAAKFPNDALALRTLASAGDRKRPTRMIEWSKQEDKRAPLFKLQRLALMENAVRPAPKCLPELSRKLSDFEDRLTLQPNASRAQFGLQLAAKALDSAGFYGGCGP